MNAVVVCQVSDKVACISSFGRNARTDLLSRVTSALSEKAGVIKKDGCDRTASDALVLNRDGHHRTFRFGKANA